VAAASKVTPARESRPPTADVTSTKVAATAAAHVAATTSAAAHVTTAAATTVTAAASSATTTVTLGARHERRSRYRNGGQHPEGPGENSCTFHLDHGFFTPSRRIS
jgi:hypothetical protein